jgi:lipoprotein-releasing system permease protein
LRVLTYGAGMKYDDWRSQLAIVRRDPDVVAAAPEVASQGLVKNAEGYPEGVAISGIEPGAGTHDVTRLDSTITQGDARFKVTDTTADGAVILGHELAARLNVTTGDLLQAVGPSSMTAHNGLGIAVPRWWTFQVTGIMKTGMFIYDNTYMFMDRSTAQRFAGLDTSITDIAIRLRDPELANVVADRLDSVLGYPHRTQTWQQQNAALFSALKLEKLAMGAVIFFIMLVAAFNIVGTLTMVVAFKTREIGILQAMGLTADGVGRVFLAQGAIVGLVGTSIGLVSGLVIAFVVDRSGLVPIDPSVYFIDHLPVHVEATDVLIVCGISLAMAVLATILPSRRAARLEPVDAIRAE